MRPRTSSPFSRATPTVLSFSTRIRSTPAEVRTSPPSALRESAMAWVIEPMPPRENPQAPMVPSTSPM